jgi:hypothetical protein
METLNRKLYLDLYIIGFLGSTRGWRGVGRGFGVGKPLNQGSSYLNPEPNLVLG